MRPQVKDEYRLPFYSPVYGTLMYLFLFFIAAYLYPGGTLADKTTVGFDWENNVYCHVLAKKAINGEPNTGRIAGLASWFCICFSLGAFFYRFAKILPYKKIVNIILQWCGILSLSIALFVFTRFHDPVVLVASILGMIPIIAILIALFKMRWMSQFWVGIFAIFFMNFHYILYKVGITAYLGTLQKISFVLIFIWFCYIDISAARKKGLLFVRQEAPAI